MLVLIMVVEGNPVLLFFGPVEKPKPKAVIPMTENFDGFELDDIELEKNFEFDPLFPRT